MEKSATYFMVFSNCTWFVLHHTKSRNKLGHVLVNNIRRRNFIYRYWNYGIHFLSISCCEIRRVYACPPFFIHIFHMFYWCLFPCFITTLLRFQIETLFIFYILFQNVGVDNTRRIYILLVRRDPYSDYWALHNDTNRISKIGACATFCSGRYAIGYWITSGSHIYINKSCSAL